MFKGVDWLTSERGVLQLSGGLDRAGTGEGEEKGAVVSQDSGTREGEQLAPGYTGARGEPQPVSLPCGELF